MVPRPVFRHFPAVSAAGSEGIYILDGIWIYLYFDDPSVFEDYAVFIKGTSFLKSKIRAAKRELHRDPETLRDRKKMFGREARHCLLDEDKINRYRSFFGRRPETVFRNETNEEDKEIKAVIGELSKRKLFRSCFPRWNKIKRLPITAANR